MGLGLNSQPRNKRNKILLSLFAHPKPQYMPAPLTQVAVPWGSHSDLDWRNALREHLVCHFPGETPRVNLREDDQVKAGVQYGHMMFDL